jgi:hypothetical protein
MAANVVTLLDNDKEIIRRKIAMEQFEALSRYSVGRADEILVLRQHILSPGRYFNSRFMDT